MQQDDHITTPDPQNNKTTNRTKHKKMPRGEAQGNTKNKRH